MIGCFESAFIDSEDAGLRLESQLGRTVANQELPISSGANRGIACSFAFAGLLDRITGLPEAEEVERVRLFSWHGSATTRSDTKHKNALGLKTQ